jgi:hypothetical protein
LDPWQCATVTESALNQLAHDEIVDVPAKPTPCAAPSTFPSHGRRPEHRRWHHLQGALCLHRGEVYLTEAGCSTRSRFTPRPTAPTVRSLPLSAFPTDSASRQADQGAVRLARSVRRPEAVLHRAGRGRERGRAAGLSAGEDGPAHRPQRLHQREARRWQL